MNIRDFGRELIRTGDLDPVYVAIHGAKLPRDQLRRLLIAYWCFYHLGAAAHISQYDGDAFWSAMYGAAANDVRPPVGARWPRASERRHFRGDAAVRAVRALAQETPEHWVRTLEPWHTEVDIMRMVQGWPLFGPWIAFKAADMMERVAGQRVEFSKDIGLMYAAPREGLALLVMDETEERLNRKYRDLLRYFSKFPAPPGCDRPCGAQEVETILCKWKSHMNGRYEVGKDIAEVRHALIGGWGSTATHLIRAAPAEV